MPHARNVETLAELLYRAEHWDLGVAPAFERLPGHRQDAYRRKAQFLSARGVVVPGAIAVDLEGALSEPATRYAAQLQETLERIARE